MSAGASEIREWAVAHAARYELEPLVEVVQGRRMNVGFRVRLFARLPKESGPGEERRAAAAEIREKLQQMLESLTPPEGSRGRVEVEPFRAAAFLSTASDWQPEVAVSARIFHGDDYLAEVTEGEKTKVYAGVRQLKEMGLKEG